MNQNTVVREVFSGFSALGSQSGSTVGIDNFRVLGDGSLEKREGYRQIASLRADVRGICRFVYEGVERLLAVAGKELYCITQGEQVKSAECFESESGEVGFFVWKDSLYILDGKRLYLYEGECAVSRALGYTPLYGKDWIPNDSTNNRIHEPLNYLSPYVRIQYKAEAPIESLFFDVNFTSVSWVRLNGRLLSASEYSALAQYDTIHFQESVYGEIEVCLTLAENYYEDSRFCSCTAASVYEDFENSHVFLYGGAEPCVLFVSEWVDAAALATDKARFSKSCGLYFPKTFSFSFGSGEPITAVQRIYDRMMIFFPSSLWITSEILGGKVTKPSFLPICHHMGCSASGAVLMTGAAAPVTVAHNGIYRWRIDKDLKEECVLTQLSERIRPLLNEAFFSSACVCPNRIRDEIWFCSPHDEKGRVFLYHPLRETWYCYGGIAADRLFDFGGGIGFTRGGKVFLFDERLSTDLLVEGERKIEASYESGWLDFGDVGTDKRLMGALLTAELGEGTLALTWEDGGLLGEVSFCCEDAAAPDLYEARMPTGRFRVAKLTLTARGAHRQRIYRAELLAQKGKS